MNINKIISQWESEKIEFKENFSDKVIETLVSFANFKWWKIFVWIKDNWEILWVQLWQESIQKWINKIKSLTTPWVIPEIYKKEIEWKIVVIFEVQEFPIKPVSFRWKYYKRVENSNHELSINEISDLHIQSINYSADRVIQNDISINDLSEKRIDDFIKEVNKNWRFKIEKETYLESFKKLWLIDNNNNITLACYLLFYKEEIRFKISIWRFKLETVIIDDNQIDSTLFEAIEEIMKLIKKHINVELKITDKIQHEQIWDYPLDAIREAVINALIHRDYLNPTNIIIKVFDNEVRITNPWWLWNITEEQLRSESYESSHRNKILAECFYVAWKIERYWTWLSRIFKLVKEYKDVVFKFIPKQYHFTSKFILNKKNEGVKNNGGLNGGINEGVNAEVKNNDGLNGGIKNLFEYIKNNPNSNIENISKYIKISKRSTERRIKELKDKWLIKYRWSKKTWWYFIINN